MATYDLVISSGHGSKVAGASDILNEVKEARRVVNRVAQLFKLSGGSIGVFHDDVSSSQAANINKIVATHNAHGRKLDVSVHFNAFKRTSNPMGVEVLYLTSNNKAKAATLSAAIAKAAGLPNRGAKQRSNLGFLNHTTKDAILIEVCFVDSTHDAKVYNTKFEAICKAISDNLLSFCGVKKTNPVPSASTPSTPTKKTYYFVRTGTYATKKQADDALAMMKKLNIVSIGSIETVGAKFRVKTGTYNTKGEANNAVNKIKNAKIAWVCEIYET